MPPSTRPAARPSAPAAPEPTSSVEFNPFLPRVRNSPFELYERLRTESPVHWVPAGGYWVVSRHEDVSEVLRSPHFSADAPHLDVHADLMSAEGLEESLTSVLRGWFLFKDGEEHSFLRNTVGQAFAPAAVSEKRPQVERMVDE